MRASRFVLALAIAGVTLAGCSPTAEPLAGVTLRDGQPVVIFVACDHGFAAVEVHEDDPSRPTPSTAPATVPTWSVVTASPGAVNEIVLFGQLPVGWRATAVDLKGLEPGVEYSVGGLSLHGAIPVNFTTGTLAKLGADQVLTATAYRQVAVITRAEFEKRAKDGCD